MINIIDKSNTYIDDTVKIGDNVTIYPNVVLEGNTVIGDNTTIYVSSYIKDSIIGKNNNIYTSYIIESQIGDNNEVGPYANIRANNNIGNNNRLGSFVELKSNDIGNNNKIPHLSFIGDAKVENNVHIGCGAITVNKKANSKEGERALTVIKDNAFVGCNVNLLAPITIGNNATVAAGSTVIYDVEDNSLAIARCKESIIKDYNE